MVGRLGSMSISLVGRGVTLDPSYGRWLAPRGTSRLSGHGPVCRGERLVRHRQPFKGQHLHKRSVQQSRPVLHEVLIAAFTLITTPITPMVLVRAALFRDGSENMDGVPRPDGSSKAASHGRRQL